MKALLFQNFLAMFKSLFSYTYGFISIIFIELGNLINTFSNIFDFIIVIIQIIIAFLTIKKLYFDVKNHKYKSIAKTEKELKNKRPFLFTLYEHLKRIKNG